MINIYQKLIGEIPISILALDHIALVFGGLLIYFFLTRMGQQYRFPTSAVSWVMLIAFVPYFGIPLFLLFGNRKFARPIRNPNPTKPNDGVQEHPAWASSLLSTMGSPPLVRNFSVTFHENGQEARHALLRLIEGAEHHIELCSYILANDEIGYELTKELSWCAERGVKVRVLLDAIGGLLRSRTYIRELQSKGVEVRWFMPLLHNPTRGRTNLRNHRKMLIVDSRKLWSGGRNFASEYFIDTKKQAAWPDLSYVVEGPLAKQAQILFDKDWRSFRGIDRAESTLIDPLEDEPGARVQLVPSGPDLADDTIYNLLLTAAYHAQNRIIAVTPYFVPDDALLSAWCLACRRGVQFTLLIPHRSNHRLADLAREQAIRQLIEAGASVFLYPSMVHAKAVVVDDQLALCGSANLDGRSLFLNFELMTVFYGSEEIFWLSDWILRKVARSNSYRSASPSLLRGVVEGVVRTVGFQI
jgi:cardiolipin synthase